MKILADGFVASVKTNKGEALKLFSVLGLFILTTCIISFDVRFYSGATFLEMAKIQQTYAT